MKSEKNSTPRATPLSIPLSFDEAVDGLLQVDPKQPVDSKRESAKPAKPKAKKKPTKGKRPGGK